MDKIPEEFEKIIDEGFGVNAPNEAKELFAVKNIGARTDLSPEEVALATKLRFLADKYEIGSLHMMLDNFMTYRLSQKRKSRGEYLKAISERIDRLQSMMGGMFNGRP